MIIVMRRTILIFLMAALSGCTFVRTYIEVRDFEKQEICFPESMISIENYITNSLNNLCVMKREKTLGLL